MVDLMEIVEGGFFYDVILLGPLNGVKVRDFQGEDVNA